MRPQELTGKHVTRNLGPATPLADFPHVRRALHLVAEDKQAYYSEAEKASPPSASSKEIQLKILMHFGTAHCRPFSMLWRAYLMSSCMCREAIATWRASTT